MLVFRFLQVKTTGIKLLSLLSITLVLAACAPQTAAPAQSEAAAPAVAATATDAPTPVEVAAAPVAADAEAAAAAPAEGVAAPAAQTVAASYNGTIVARSEVNIVTEVGGEVLEVAVEVGDRVQAGDVLVRTDGTRLEAQQAQALAGLDAVQAQLELLTTPAAESDIAAAQAGVAAASAAYRKAAAGPTAEDLRMAEAQVRLARAGVNAAQAAYNQVKGDINIATRPENLRLQQAQLQLEAAQAQYDKLQKGATQDVIAVAYAQVAQSQAMLKNLQNGAPSEQIEAVEAQVQQAEAGLYLAQLQMNKAVVKSPIDGIVTRVATSPGATASPGSLMVVLLSEGVEVTIPVEEARLASLEVGQPATIRVAAYPDRSYEGKIALIAPRLDAASRTVKVTIRPNEATPELFPGMFATVELLQE